MTTSKPTKPPKPRISTSYLSDEGKKESSLKAGELLVTTVSTPLTTISNVSTTDITKTTSSATTSTITTFTITTTTTASTSSTGTTSTTPPSTTKYVPNFWDLLMNRYGLNTEGVEEGSSLPQQPNKAGETCTNTVA